MRWSLLPRSSTRRAAARIWPCHDRMQEVLLEEVFLVIWIKWVFHLPPTGFTLQPFDLVNKRSASEPKSRFDLVAETVVPFYHVVPIVFFLPRVKLLCCLADFCWTSGENPQWQTHSFRASHVCNHQPKQLNILGKCILWQFHGTASHRANIIVLIYIHVPKT